MHIKTSKHNREYFNHIVTDQLSIHNSCTKPLQFISLNSNLRYVINICLTVIMLLYFTSELKSQYNSIEKLDRINNDSIVNILKVIQLEKYNIKKGHHSPKNRRIILHSSREFSAICMFDKSCLYSFADNNSRHAINKIFGYSFGLNHHNNSFRIGWRCQDKLIEILAYWYINHKRYNKHLFFIKSEKRFFINVKMESGKAMINYLIEDMQLESNEVIYNPEKQNLRRWGYVNYPYFGGKQKSPNNMVIYLKTWMIK